MYVDRNLYEALFFIIESCITINKVIKLHVIYDIFIIILFERTK
jgi:hypothetical protein